MYLSLKRLTCKFYVSTLVYVFILQSSHQYYTRSSYDYFEKFTKHQSARVVNLLGNILTKKYPKFGENPTLPLMDLLEWDLWPAYISIYGLNLYVYYSTESYLVYMEFFLEGHWNGWEIYGSPDHL